MRIKLFDKHYDLIKSKVLKNWFLYENNKFHIEITLISGNLYDLFIYPVVDIAPHVLNKHYSQVLDLNNIEYVDLLDYISIPHLVELSIRYKLDLIDEKYGILI